MSDEEFVSLVVLGLRNYDYISHELLVAQNVDGDLETPNIVSMTIAKTQYQEKRLDKLKEKIASWTVFAAGTDSYDT